MANVDLFNDLSDDEIEALGNGGGQRGQYKELLKAFIESGKRGVSIDASALGVKVATVAVGFNNARKNMEEASSVRVVTDSKNDRVSLVNSAA